VKGFSCFRHRGFAYGLRRLLKHFSVLFHLLRDGQFRRLATELIWLFHFNCADPITAQCNSVMPKLTHGDVLCCCGTVRRWRLGWVLEDQQRVVWAVAVDQSSIPASNAPVHAAAVYDTHTHTYTHTHTLAFIIYRKEVWHIDLVTINLSAVRITIALRILLITKSFRRSETPSTLNILKKWI